MLNLEAWIQIPNFTNYQISNYGRIKSMARPSSGIKPRMMREKILCKSINVTLARDGGYVRVKVSRLVCAAFNGKPETAAHECSHIDGDQKNNCADNLRWVTTQERIADTARRAPHKKPMTEAEASVESSRERIWRMFTKESWSVGSLATKFSVEKSAIHRALQHMRMVNDPATRAEVALRVRADRRAAMATSNGPRNKRSQDRAAELSEQRERRDRAKAERRRVREHHTAARNERTAAAEKERLSNQRRLVSLFNRGATIAYLANKFGIEAQEVHHRLRRDRLEMEKRASKC